MASWWRGTAGDWVSMGVFSDGSYGTPAGVMFSFPVTIKDGQWTIVQVTTIYSISTSISTYLLSIAQGLELSDFAKTKLAETGKELCEEREEAMAVCSQ